MVHILWGWGVEWAREASSASRLRSSLPCALCVVSEEYGGRLEKCQRQGGPARVTGGVLAGRRSPVGRSLEEARCSDSGRHSSSSGSLSELNDKKQKQKQDMVFRHCTLDFEECEDEVRSLAGTQWLETGEGCGTWPCEEHCGQLLAPDHQVSLGLSRSFSIPNTFLACMSFNHPCLEIGGVLAS